MGDTQQRNAKIEEILRQTRSASKVDAHKDEEVGRIGRGLCRPTTIYAYHRSPRAAVDRDDCILRVWALCVVAAGLFKAAKLGAPTDIPGYVYTFIGMHRTSSRWRPSASATRSCARGRTSAPGF